MEKGADVECPNKYGKTPLFYAASPEIVSLLLETGAYPAVRSLTRSTALMQHVADCRAACVECLLKGSRVVDAIPHQCAVHQLLVAWLYGSSYCLLDRQGG